MKITFLGTAHGVPLEDRFCSCTMIESGNSIYFIDAGAPVIDLMLRYKKDVSDLRAVFTTHSHGDHTAGLLHLIDLISWYYKESSADIYLANSAQLPAYTALLKAQNGELFEFPDRLRFHLTDPSTPYEDENISLEYFRNCHMPNSYSILVTEKSSGKTALFSGDMSIKLAKGDFPSLLSEKEVDMFVCEMAHFGIHELSPYLETCKAKAVYFNHVFPLSKYDDIESLKGKYPFSVHTPSDGDVVEL